MELERSENIIIITHQAIVRCIFSYFMEIPQEKSPWMEVPLHTLMKLTPKAYGTEVERFKADIPAVSTWRPKGSTAKHHDSISEGIPEDVVGNSPQNVAVQKASNVNAKEKGKVPSVAMTGLPLP
jgi:6-phosphofructo-2-kinase/fructose-2,6-biphosphatase 2